MKRVGLVGVVFAAVCLMPLMASGAFAASPIYLCVRESWRAGDLRRYDGKLQTEI
jgi:hypothetical protein